MAFLDTAINVGVDLAQGGSLIDGAFALITQRKRRIGFIIPHVVTEETHVDDMAVTDHPVETGAAITDHAFMLPQQVEMRCGFSDSKAGFPGFARLTYEAFLSLQRSRQPFTVTTGKRQYKDMLIKSMVVTTDAHSENILNVVICLRQIILTKTASSAMADQGSQANPDSTASATEQGLKNTIPTFAQPGGGTPTGPSSPFIQGGTADLPIFGSANAPSVSAFDNVNFGS